MEWEDSIANRMVDLSFADHGSVWLISDAGWNSAKRSADPVVRMSPVEVMSMRAVLDPEGSLRQRRPRITWVRDFGEAKPKQDVDELLMTPQLTPRMQEDSAEGYAIEREFEALSSPVTTKVRLPAEAAQQLCANALRGQIDALEELSDHPAEAEDMLAIAEIEIQSLKDQKFMAEEECLRLRERLRWILEKGRDSDSHARSPPGRRHSVYGA